MEAIRILLVDDHHIVRQGIRSLLETEPDLRVVGEAANAREALALVDEAPPDVVVLDVRLPDMDGAEVCRRIAARHPQLPTLILTAFSDDATVLGCVRAGARGYLLKDTDLPELVRAIRAVHRGDAVLHPKAAGVVMGELRCGQRQGERAAALSQREEEILRLAAEGLTNREIGERLFLSASTIKLHMSRMMDRFGVGSRAALVREAARRGLI
ncbi:MAG: response regulator transcription factor [Anaerolineae bacterium]|nr:response regulator transcription factor [Anaerolineae bacterium]